MSAQDTTPVGPLAWMRVVDLTDLRGALCARILADFGADVVRVERAEPSESFAHSYRNANKRGVVLDLDGEAGRARLDHLLTDADVLVENLDRDVRATLGLTPEDLAARHPHLVHVAVTDLGLSGRRASWHLEPLPALAASGALWASGFPDLPPCNGPGHLAHDCASVYGAIGAVAAALDRARGLDGAGQLVEVSAQEAGLAALIPWSVAMEDYLRVNPLLPADGRRNADGAYWVLPAEDGWVRIVVGSPKQWAGFKTLMRTDTFEADEWRNPQFRLMNADVIRTVAQERLTDRTRLELFTEALGLGATVGVLNQPSEFVAHPQTRTRAYFAASGIEGCEGLPFATQPVRMARTPTSIRAGATQDTDVEFAPRTPPPSGSLGRGHDRLLDGVRVVEFGVAAVVPEMCGVLSELGADVIKIESRANLDVLRMGSGRIELIDQNFTFNDECRGRRSVALDLNTDRGRELALELCASADVVAENQRGGALERRGLGYDDVRARNPRVIYASSQGYGRGGPLGEMPAYGPLNSGFSGVHLLWNHPDAPYPCGTSMNHPDHVAGRLLAVGVLAALAEREESGEGQHLELAQTEAAAYLIGEIYLEAARAGADPPPLGNSDPHAAPHGVYPSAGDDQWVAVAVTDDHSWHALRTALGWDDDPSLRAGTDRIARRPELDARLSEWTRTRTKEAAAEFLQAHGVSAMPVMGPRDHHADEHMRQRGAIVTLHHPLVGDERHIGNPLRMSRLPQRRAEAAPLMGADTEAVLTSVLGLSPDDVAQLVAHGVCR
jgi:crotonobetainyl-CoA:carnitine CoA-transferase CaiB-like acyl-CoA transferase